MDPILVPVDQKLSDQAAQIAALEAELAVPHVTYVLGSLQTVQPEQLWYEARSPGAPKTGPHGTVVVAVGEPAVANFQPIRLPGGQSDNVYLLRRLWPFLTSDMQTVALVATKLTIGCEVSFDNIANVQAFELDYQIRRNDGTVINVGLQLLPDGTLRVFDYVAKAWVPTGAKATVTSTMAISLTATCDGKTVQFVSVAVNGVSTPITQSHPTSPGTPGSLYLNAAYQLDAKAAAPAYKATVGKMFVSFGT